MNVTKMIKGHDLFRSFNFDEIARVSDHSRSILYKQGDVVFRRGQEGTHFYVLLEGQVNLTIPSKTRTPHMVLGRVEKEEIFGLAPLLGFETYSTTADIAAESTILAVEIVPFRQILENNTNVYLNVMNTIARAYFSRYIDTMQRFHNTLHDLAAEATG